jgi:hypothetical protein
MYTCEVYLPRRQWRPTLHCEPRRAARRRQATGSVCAPRRRALSQPGHPKYGRNLTAKRAAAAVPNAAAQEAAETLQRKCPFFHAISGNGTHTRGRLRSRAIATATAAPAPSRRAAACAPSPAPSRHGSSRVCPPRPGAGRPQRRSLRYEGAPAGKMLRAGVVRAVTLPPAIISVTPATLPQSRPQPAPEPGNCYCP